MSINNIGQPVVVDSNIIIKEIQEGRSLHPIAKRIKKHKSKMVIPESVLGEVEKVTGNQADVIMDTIYEFCKHPITLDKTDEIKAESERLVDQYYECHCPDSMILATAKLTGSALVSFDRELLQTAKLEGVQAFLPRNFVRWW
ncbi:MAG: type II toxin-antitoxin system VapC family toxin [Nitrosopumilaceae archaeon]